MQIRFAYFHINSQYENCTFDALAYVLLIMSVLLSALHKTLQMFLHAVKIVMYICFMDECFCAVNTKCMLVKD